MGTSVSQSPSSDSEQIDEIPLLAWKRSLDVPLASARHVALSDPSLGTSVRNAAIRPWSVDTLRSVHLARAASVIARSAEVRAQTHFGADAFEQEGSFITRRRQRTVTMTHGIPAELRRLPWRVGLVQAENQDEERKQTDRNNSMHRTHSVRLEAPQSEPLLS